MARLRQDHENQMHKIKRSGRKEGTRIFLLMLPYGLLFLAFIAIPIVIAIGLSFTYFDVINAPKFAGISNYVNIVTQDEAFLKFIIPNTLKYALIVGPGGYVLSFLLAWMLTQIQRVPRTILTLAFFYTILSRSGIYPGNLENNLFR
jgi:multiple sugar transport system permease protein